MKIVHVETGMHLYGGGQQVAYLLAGLQRRGIDSTLVSPPNAAIGAYARQIGVPTVDIPCSGDLDLAFIPRLARTLRAQHADLVHLHSRRGADVLGALAARLAGVPAVLSRRVDNREARLWAALKYRLPARVVTISQGIAEVLTDCGVDAQRLRVVRSAVDPAPWTQAETRTALRAEFGLPAQGLIAGVVAQLIERKGHRVLLQALRQLRDSGALAADALHLLCFGQGPLHDTLIAETAALGLAHCVHFVGFRRDLARWMGALDLLVHPAHMEGLGVSLLQASSAGVPIIASRAGGMPEAVRDGENGLLVPPGNAAALAAALARLLGDTALRRQLGDDGRALIAREFSVDAMVDGNLAVYRELV